MIVRIRLGRGRALRHTRGTNRGLALAAAALLVPAALMAYVLGVWRLASDLGMAGEFAWSGLFSHWQVWIAVAVTAHAASSILNRYGRGGALRLPRLFSWLPRSPKPGPPPSSQPPSRYDTPRPKAR